jgi:Family of unknown function (DUF6113)
MKLSQEVAPLGPGRPYSLLCVEGGQTGQRQERGVAAAYVALFVLGAMEGLLGCFQFSHSLGRIPVMSLAFCALILVTCVAGAAGMGTPLGGVLPAIGWLAASFVLTLPTAAGSVIVTNTVAGKWYLYGGAACAATGIVASFRWRKPVSSRWPGAGG